MLIPRYFTGCLLIGLLLISCKKNESYDIIGDPEVKFFISNTGPGNLPDNAINYTVVNIPDVNGSGLVNLSTSLPAAVKFPVYASRPVDVDVTVEAQLDTSLISSYNLSHNTNYLAFPAGVINTDGLAAHIAKGTSTSADSISIGMNIAALNVLTQPAYIAPIKLTKISNPSAGKITANTTTQVIYVVANVELRRIKYLALPADALGSLITPRTSWTVNFTPTPSTIASVIDGVTTTYSRWTTPISPYGMVDINLQATKNVTGIRLYTSSSSTYVPAQVDVLLSNDGISYDLIGSPLKANISFTSSYSYILFYKAISAKYVRLRIYYSTSTSSNNGRLAELDVYAN
ncbi:MAG: BT_3987 domain-containing protein [Flavisolibacter sp.]